MQQAGQNIKAIREMKNLTQYYMASQLKMSVPNYSNIETGKTSISLDRLQAIARILEIDSDQILNLSVSKLLSTSSINNKGDLQSQHFSYEELIRQIKIKDEQINRLLTLIENRS